MKKKIMALLFSALMLILIFDNQAVQESVLDGIRLCITALIPSLLPFLFLSALLSEYMSTLPLPFLRSLEKILQIPENSGSIFLIGLLAGYPVGAQFICQAVSEHRMTLSDGNRMLRFCSNAGPSFIFGIGFSLFENRYLCWLVWLVQILSALSMGLLTHDSVRKTIPLKQSLQKTSVSFPLKPIATMSMICGWVIIFRIIITFLSKWGFCFLPDILSVLITGTLELANGCTMLKTMPSEFLRFILFCYFLAFGGVCVTMQTLSIVRKTGLHGPVYLRGKLCQGLLAAGFATIIYMTVMFIK